jgi:hypothetical protein
MILVYIDSFHQELNVQKEIFNLIRLVIIFNIFFYFLFIIYFVLSIKIIK